MKTTATTLQTIYSLGQAARKATEIYQDATEEAAKALSCDAEDINCLAEASSGPAQKTLLQAKYGSKRIKTLLSRGLLKEKEGMVTTRDSILDTTYEIAIRSRKDVHLRKRRSQNYDPASTAYPRMTE